MPLCHFPKIAIAALVLPVLGACTTWPPQPIFPDRPPSNSPLRGEVGVGYSTLDGPIATSELTLSMCSRDGGFGYGAGVSGGTTNARTSVAAGTYLGQSYDRDDDRARRRRC